MAELDDPRHQDLLNWLLTPKANRNPPTQKAFAEKWGVSERTVRDWRDAPKFQDAWREGVRDAVASPERTHEILEALAVTARDSAARGQVGAAKLFFEQTGSILPIAPKTTDASSLTDEQLHALLAELATRKLAELNATEATNG